MCITTRRSRSQELQAFLGDMYNAKRLHSSLNNIPPEEFEADYLKCSCSVGMDFLGHSNFLLSCLLSRGRNQTRGKYARNQPPILIYEAYSS